MVPLRIREESPDFLRDLRRSRGRGHWPLLVFLGSSRLRACQPLAGVKG
jgi:hypothetical protein